MTRSIYRQGFPRAVDAEGGGAADLQTDVMRFMAILAICLVVIFALVQSIPLTPAPIEPAEPEPVVEPEPPAEAEPPAEPIEIAAPVRAPQAPPAPEAIPEPPPAQQPVEQEGFTLRFESDDALTRLVERNVIGLYALGADRPLRMQYSQGRVSFWEASTPNQYHEMEPATVPSRVIKAMLRTNDVDPVTIRWGVTLPADMQRELGAYLESETGGALVIAADGTLRLEP